MQINLEHAAKTQLSLTPENAQEEMLLVNIVRVFINGGLITASPWNRNEYPLGFDGVTLNGDRDSIRQMKDYIS